MAIVLTGFRRGERWAWYTMWLWPLMLALNDLVLLNAYKQPGPGIPPPLISGSTFIVVILLTLGLTYRKFFPKQRQAVSAPIGG